MGVRAEKEVERIISLLIFVKAQDVIGYCGVSVFPYVVVIWDLSHCLDDARDDCCEVGWPLDLCHSVVIRFDDAIHVRREYDRCFVITFIRRRIEVYVLTIVRHFGFFFAFIPESLFSFTSSFSFTFLTVWFSFAVFFPFTFAFDLARVLGIGAANRIVMVCFQPLISPSSWL